MWSLSPVGQALPLKPWLCCPSSASGLWLKTKSSLSPQQSWASCCCSPALLMAFYYPSERALTTTQQQINQCTLSLGISCLTFEHDSPPSTLFWGGQTVSGFIFISEVQDLLLKKCGDIPVCCLAPFWCEGAIQCCKTRKTVQAHMGKWSNHLLPSSCCYFYLHLSISEKQISILNSPLFFSFSF